MARREHAGGAQDTTLVGDITSSATSITITSGTGWPTGSGGKFWVAIDPDTASEEHILVNARSGTGLTVASSADRGLDGTTAQSHSSGAVVRHIFAAVEADNMALLDATNTYTAKNTFNATTGSQIEINGYSGQTQGFLRAFDSNGDKQVEFQPDGQLFATGDVFLGDYAMGTGVGTRIRLQSAASSVSLLAESDATTADVSVVVKAKGNGTVKLQRGNGTSVVEAGFDGSAAVLGFFAGTPAAKQTITGSRGSATATVLGNLLTALATYGLIVNSSTA